MREVRFHRELYRGEAVDAAAKVYAPYARIELTEEPTHWVVRVSAASPVRELRVASRLAHQALGATVRERG